MNNHIPDNLVFLILVADRKQKDALISEIFKADCRIINTIYAKGSVKANYLVEMLGFIPEENKVVITCTLRREKIDALFAILLNQFKFNRPNTGIAFTVPIVGISF